MRRQLPALLQLEEAVWVQVRLPLLPEVLRRVSEELARHREGEQVVLLDVLVDDLRPQLGRKLFKELVAVRGLDFGALRRRGEWIRSASHRRAVSRLRGHRAAVPTSLSLLVWVTRVTFLGEQKKKKAPGGDRTHNLLITATKSFFRARKLESRNRVLGLRSQTPYPLGHRSVEIPMLKILKATNDFTRFSLAA